MNFDSEQSNIEIGSQGKAAKKKEVDYYTMRKKAMTEMKKLQKCKIQDESNSMIKEIQKKQDELDQIRASTQEDYNFKIINLIKEYESTLNKLQ